MSENNNQPGGVSSEGSESPRPAPVMQSLSAESCLTDLRAWIEFALQGVQCLTDGYSYVKIPEWSMRQKLDNIHTTLTSLQVAPESLAPPLPDPSCACGDIFNENFKGTCPNCIASDYLPRTASTGSAETETGLLPCPFCGCTEIDIRDNGIGDSYVICGIGDEEENLGCGARTDDRKCESDEQAAGRWNTRASDDLEAKIREAVIAVIHACTVTNLWDFDPEIKKASRDVFCDKIISRLRGTGAI